MNYEGQITGHRGWVTALACPQQADSYIKVVSTSRDGTTMTWKLNPNRHSVDDIYAVPDHRLEGHSGFVAGISLAHATEYAITASWDRSLRLWSLRTGQCQGKFLKHTKDVLAVAFSPEDRQIVSGGRDNVLRVWNVKGECVHTLEQGAHSDWVSSLCFSPSNSTLVVSGSWDNTVKVWDLADSKCIKTLVGHTNYVTSVTVSPDGSLCASGGKDGVARLWDLNTGDSLFELNVEAHINQVAFSPNRFWLCVAAASSVRVYDLESKAAIIELEPDTENHSDCLCIAWSADGNTLFSGYSDNTIKVWSLSDSE
ncbi:guanine nucleotide-binding protein subunit beta-2-like 1 protein [Strigomonas culicis]|uniref:Guanine nucleotide-binding protein subunit beta-2-like 1 protein n=1 Tax=Strigomonas culicis TaxID=28005 RepID=S9VFX0_9TRYP|nr:guanine nucleotide-binding protein subunit beta-2-like 1 protein [Strigomonas culicis]|eukprot:EPY25941.1 guanine nucleotide-binding protein subunit beta-2-like 1 protein [Strigomonas culicis]